VLSAVSPAISDLSVPAHLLIIGRPVPSQEAKSPE